MVPIRTCGPVLNSGCWCCCCCFLQLLPPLTSTHWNVNSIFKHLWFQLSTSNRDSHRFCSKCVAHHLCKVSLSGESDTMVSPTAVIPGLLIPSDGIPGPTEEFTLPNNLLDEPSLYVSLAMPGQNYSWPSWICLWWSIAVTLHIHSPSLFFFFFSERNKFCTFQGLPWILKDIWHLFCNPQWRCHCHCWACAGQCTQHTGGWADGPA